MKSDTGPEVDFFRYLRGRVVAGCLVCDRIAEIERGTNPTFIAALSAGYAVMGDEQFLPGYCVLLAKLHVVELHDMPGDEREQFLRDMVALGAAVARATSAAKMNYALLGNAVPHLHCHVHPRYAWEPDEYRRGPIGQYPQETRSGTPFDPARHGELLSSIRAQLAKVS